MYKALLAIALFTHSFAYCGDFRTPAQRHDQQDLRKAIESVYMQLFTAHPQDISALNHIRFAFAGVLSQGIGGEPNMQVAGRLLDDILGTAGLVERYGSQDDHMLYAMAQLERAKLAISRGAPLPLPETIKLLRAAFTNQKALPATRAQAQRLHAVRPQSNLPPQ